MRTNSGFGTGMGAIASMLGGAGGSGTKVDTAAMRSAASAFRDTSKDANTNMQAMLDIVTNLSSWSGLAANAYKGKIQGLANDVSRFLAIIAEHAEKLDQMATEYENAEKNNEQTAAQLAKDIIN